MVVGFCNMRSCFSIDSGNDERPGEMGPTARNADVPVHQHGANTVAIADVAFMKMSVLGARARCHPGR
jgi:hypothetical protein